VSVSPSYSHKRGYSRDDALLLGQLLLIEPLSSPGGTAIAMKQNHALFPHGPSHWTRRQLLQFGIGGWFLPIAVFQLSHCQLQTSPIMGTSKQIDPAATGQLRSRPFHPATARNPGLHPLQLDGKRDGLLYVPASYRAERPAPLVLMLHGAGGDAEGALNILRQLVDPVGTIVLAVDSRRQTWDVILGQYGPDVAFIDRALAQTFSRYAIDPERVGVAGFSDGASYALSLGIMNGDLFTHVLAFSPGFMAPIRQAGDPHIFIAHGTQDRVLPIDRCSRKLVPQLKGADYRVLYQEFEGPHTVPAAIARAALEWFVHSDPNQV
jgi:phospholipase/carboxylesterase